MLNGIHERGMNKDENIKAKIRKYPRNPQLIFYLAPEQK